MSQLKSIATLESFLERAKEGEIDGIVIVATRGPNYVSHGIHCDTEYLPIVLASLNATTRKLNRMWDEGIFQRTDDEVVHEPAAGGARVSGMEGAKVTRDEKGNVTVTLDPPDEEPGAEGAQGPAEGAGGDGEPEEA